jgi:hypothetical protein
MPARAINPGIGDRAGAKDQFVFGREGVHPRRVLSHEEVRAQSLASQGGFKQGIREGFLLKSLCLQMDSQNLVKTTFHRGLLEPR